MPQVHRSFFTDDAYGGRYWNSLTEELRFRDACAAAKVLFGVTIRPGANDWDFWDAKIQDVLALLPLTGPEISP